MARPTNQITQAAYVVNDLRAAIDRWMTTSNIGPFYIMENCEPENVIYRGAPGQLKMDLAFCQAGPVQIELIQPTSTGPNMYRDSYPEGTEGYHHQCYFTDDLDRDFAHYAALGVEVAVQATFGSLRFAYFDTRHLIGCMTEVMQHDEAVEGMFKMIADAAIDWDGTDPVRMVGG
jgi:methylmalonyl-CoA/ethylmalonyl-CoA epimerase